MIRKGFALAVIALALLFPLTKSPFAAKAEEDNSIKSEYELGSEVSFPEKSLLVGGERVPSFTRLIYPDGKAYCSDKYSLDTEGKYSLVYQSSKGNDIETEEYDFFVRSALVFFASPSASASLKEDGIGLTWNDESAASLSAIIPMNGYSLKDPLVTVRINPAVSGTKDFSKLRFVFTDVEDATNSLTFLIQASPYASGTSYALAAGKSQQLSGYEAEHDRLHVNNQFGAPFGFSFSGDEGFNEVSLSFDSQSLVPSTGENNPIINLGSDKFFKKPWGGFASGKARLSITPENLLGETASVDLVYLRGASLKTLSSGDTLAPSIKIDLMGNEKPPLALVGHSYPLFPASAVDLDSGVAPVASEVFFHYGKPNQITVDSVDGVFTPREEGVYTVIYEAKDYFANSVREIVEITASSRVSSPSLSVASSSKVTSGYVGAKIPLGKALSSGGTGALTTSIDVSLFGETVETDGVSFVPLSEGTYEVFYTLKDYIGQTATDSYNIAVTRSDKPIFSSEPSLPKYLLNNESYRLPSLTAVDYSSGKAEEIVAEPSFFADSHLSQGSNGTVLVKTTSDQGAIRYTAKGASVDYSLPVVHAKEEDGLHMERYFVGVEASALQDAISLPLGQESEFANALLAESFSLKFACDPSNSLFKSLRFNLSDSENPDQSLSIVITGSGTGSVVNAGGVSLFIKEGWSPSSSSNDFSFYLSGTNLVVNGESQMALATFDDGRAFKGFSSGSVYLSVSAAEGASSSLLVKSINGQTLNSGRKDSIKPRIQILGEYGGDKKKGDYGSVAKAIAIDVLDPLVSVSVSVYSPDGKYATLPSGTEASSLDCSSPQTILLNEYGSWRLDYIAYDSHNGSKARSIYSYKVVDEEAPLITVDRENISLKVGAILQVPSFEVSDNCTEKSDITVVVYLIDAEGTFETLTEGKKDAMAEGKYTIRISAYDESSNMSFIDIPVEVIS